MTDHTSPNSNPATSELTDATANGTTNGAASNAPTFRVPDGAPQGTQARGALDGHTDPISDLDAPQSTLEETASDSADLQGDDAYDEPWNEEQGPRVAPDELPEEFVDWPENSTPENATEESVTPAEAALETALPATPISSNEREAGGWEPPAGSGYEGYPSSGSLPVDDSVVSEPDYDQYPYTNDFIESGIADDVRNENDESTLATSGSGSGGDGGGDFGGSALPPDDDARVPSHYQESLDANAPVNDREQDLIEHLAELRTRILHSVSAVVIVMMGTWNYGKQISGWFSHPIREALKKYGIDGKMVTNDPTEGFMTQFQIAFVAAILIAMPFLLFQIWRFVEPALTKRERRFTGSLIPFSVLLFFAGCAMGYAVSPLFFQFFLQFQPPDSSAYYSYGTSILLLAKMILVFGVCFQVPVVVIFLHKAGIVSRNLLIEYWRHVVVVIFTVVAIITPTWDPLTLMVCGIPPCLLYLFSIWLIKWL